MNETVAIPKELLEKIMKKMECVENRIKRLGRLMSKTAVTTRKK